VSGAAALAASWCTRRLGRPYAQPVWQMLADAARLGVIRDGQPEAWAVGAVIALARASGLLESDLWRGVARSDRASRDPPTTTVTLALIRSPGLTVILIVGEGAGTSSYQGPR
jgi:hypothetical protein